MKRLLLASHGIGALPSLAGRDTAGLHFAFVPTAAGPEAETKPWIQADRRQLEILGCTLSTLDLAAVGAREVEKALRDVDGVFVSGGNSYLLLWHARRSGFAELVTGRVQDGSLLYVGTSAGSLVASPDIAPAASLDNRREVPELESSAALALVPFTVLPHDDDPETAAIHDGIVAAHPSVSFVRLADDQAVLVRGDSVEVVGSPPVE
jgi:dipeptidase E